MGFVEDCFVWSSGRGKESATPRFTDVINAFCAAFFFFFFITKNETFRSSFFLAFFYLTFFVDWSILNASYHHITNGPSETLMGLPSLSSSNIE